MKTVSKALLLAMASMPAGPVFELQPHPGMGYQHTTKKHKSKPRRIKPDGNPEFKNRNKKGRP